MASTWFFVFSLSPVSVQFEPPVYLMVAGSVISTVQKEREME